MNTPRNIASAQREGYVIKRINYKESTRVLVIMEPRFYNYGMKAQVSFWTGRNYAKRLVGETRWIMSV